VKKKLTGSSDPDLHLKNEMISSIKAVIKADSIDFKITDSKQKKKAFNHSTPKDSINKVPKRMFLPNDEKESGAEKNFSPKIREGIVQILRKYNAGEDNE